MSQTACLEGFEALLTRVRYDPVEQTFHVERVLRNVAPSFFQCSDAASCTAAVERALRLEPAGPPNAALSDRLLQRLLDGGAEDIAFELVARGTELDVHVRYTALAGTQAARETMVQPEWGGKPGREKYYLVVESQPSMEPPRRYKTRKVAAGPQGWREYWVLPRRKRDVELEQHVASDVAPLLGIAGLASALELGEDGVAVADAEAQGHEADAVADLGEGPSEDPGAGDVGSGETGEEPGTLGEPIPTGALASAPPASTETAGGNSASAQSDPEPQLEPEPAPPAVADSPGPVAPAGSVVSAPAPAPAPALAPAPAPAPAPALPPAPAPAPAVAPESAASAPVSSSAEAPEPTSSAVPGSASAPAAASALASSAASAPGSLPERPSDSVARTAAPAPDPAASGSGPAGSSPPDPPVEPVASPQVAPAVWAPPDPSSTARVYAYDLQLTGPMSLSVAIGASAHLLPRVERCWQEHPTSDGQRTAFLGAVIRGDGFVASTSVTGEIGDPALRGCLNRAVGDWSFPSWGNAEQLSDVVLPFVLRVEPETERRKGRKR